MRLAGREWRVLVGTVRLGRDSYRVVRPVRPLKHARLCEGYLGAHLSVDEVAAGDLAAAWWLAARSPHSLVYLPLRGGVADCGEEYGGPRLDLVLLHHRVRFPVSRWKQVRARLGPGRPHKVSLPVGALPGFGVEAYLRRYHRGFRDHLRWDVAADTLFLTGSRHAYELAGAQLRGLVEDCPAHLARQPGTHCCAEIDLGRGRARQDRRRPYAELHVQACNEHW
ncbi:hypothetical protein JOF53_007396 [Crossiella equi]|uniref:Uncharacterized protein n=1 Tax=Crossiella equi TaxID=130796 RepID=A0ABS5AQN3_9PSEU|nr:hypothetical protein [Crossiella equi]MBP2478524.1 hypothetical protein [Crossiella equi]